MFVIRKIAEKQGFGGMITVGKSKAKVYVEKDTGVTFDDVAGIDEAKAELQEVVSFLDRAADDLARVADIARQIVTRFGMHPAVGQAVLEAQWASFLGEDSAPGIVPRDCSEATAREVDLAVT